MKLNSSYLGVKFQRNESIIGHLTLSAAYLSSHLNEDAKAEMERSRELARLHNIPLSSDSQGDWWGYRKGIATSLSKPAKKMYVLTQQVQDAAMTIKLDKIDLKWFRQIPPCDCMYIPNKDEFYRFTKTDTRVNVLHYYYSGSGIPMDYRYDCYSIILNEGILAQAPYQNKEMAERFIRFLLFMELGEITINVVHPNGKVKFGKSGEDKIKNEAGLDAILVTTNWNKITVVQGEIPVRGHTRVQPCGVGRSDYKLIWINDFVKQGYTRHSGKILDNAKQ
jgi:hypothetical protein